MRVYAGSCSRGAPRITLTFKVSCPENPPAPPQLAGKLREEGQPIHSRGSDACFNAVGTEPDALGQARCGTRPGQVNGARRHRPHGERQAIPEPAILPRDRSLASTPAGSITGVYACGMDHRRLRRLGDKLPHGQRDQPKLRHGQRDQPRPHRSDAGPQCRWRNASRPGASRSGLLKHRLRVIPSNIAPRQDCPMNLWTRSNREHGRRVA